MWVNRVVQVRERGHTGYFSEPVVGSSGSEPLPTCPFKAAAARRSPEPLPDFPTSLPALPDLPTTALMHRALLACVLYANKF
jgi:hypothetical protein